MTTKEKIHQKLGFNNKETSRLVDEINFLLASYHVHYQKLRNFHWNITGADFFELHEKFEELYNFSKTNIDDLAERIRVFKKKPLARLDEYLKYSKIDEPIGEPSASEMVDSVLSDFEILLSQMISTLDIANEIGDVSTIDLLNSMVKQTEKYYWMFTAYQDRN